MRLLWQNVSDVKIYQEEKLIFERSEKSCLVYVGLEKDDEKKDMRKIVNKIEEQQLVERDGKITATLRELKPFLIFISNITLVASWDSKRITFNQALEPEKAREIFYSFVKIFIDLGYLVWKNEKFGSYLKITATNLGPINLFLKL